MKNSRINKHSKCVLFSSFLLLSGLFTSQSVWAGIVVVVHPKNSVSSLSKAQVAEIFLAKEKAFPNGKTATPLDQEQDSAIRKQFYKTVTNKSNAQVMAYWSRLIFTGQGQPPREMYDNAEVISTITTDKSAIGYIDDSAVNPRVKVVYTLP